MFKFIKKGYSQQVVFSTLCILLAIVFTLSVGFTLAEWKTQDDTVNLITMGSVAGRISEKYEQGQTVNPAAKIEKVVCVENTGSIDAFVRVKIKKTWGNDRDENGNIIENTELNTDNIVIPYNTKDWYETDGYWYYKGILKPKEITPPLFDNFVIEGSTTDSEYSGKTADIVVSMEIIQAAGNGISYWGISPEEIDVKYTSSIDESVTKIEFISPHDGFIFNTENGDLFSNFKNLVPGENRSQTVNVTNKWNNPAEIFLYADYIDQDYSSDETSELIEKLLKEYAIIAIKDGKGNTIYSGPVWGNLDDNTTGVNSMRDMKSLGVFKKGETKQLNVSLSLDTQMDNKYQDLLGKIKWVVYAQGAENSENFVINSDIPSDTIKTGGELKLYVYIGVMFISAMLLIILLCFKKSERQD